MTYLRTVKQKEVLHYRNTINFQINHQNTVVLELQRLTETSQQLQYAIYSPDRCANSGKHLETKIFSFKFLPHL